MNTGASSHSSPRHVCPVLGLAAKGPIPECLTYRKGRPAYDTHLNSSSEVEIFQKGWSGYSMKFTVRQSSLSLMLSIPSRKGGSPFTLLPGTTTDARLSSGPAFDDSVGHGGSGRTYKCITFIAGKQHSVWFLGLIKYSCPGALARTDTWTPLRHVINAQKAHSDGSKLCWVSS